jgi:3-oxoacyl-[acyl-carrier protein] reductase
VGWWEDRAALAGTVAVISGGAGGLGRGATLDLAANGVSVAVLDRDERAVAEITELLDGAGTDSLVQIGDAREPDTLAALFDAVDRRWGRLDILVNVVGGTFSSPFSDTVPKAWSALLRTNLDHVLHATSLAIPRIRAGGRGGSIINVTTIEAHRAAPNFAVYAAAKAAVTHFGRTLAVELGPDRIRVNSIAPDITPTPNMVAIGADAAGFASPSTAAVAIPMGRVGQISDIGNAVVFLASGLSAYITGTTLHPDGGTFAASGWFNWPDEGFSNTIPAHVAEHLAARAGRKEKEPRE